jgi:hypothetical protein
MKSREQRGASAPNIIELKFNSDADALQFGLNLEQITSCKVVSIDKLLSSNYTLPYPAGTDAMSRTALTDGASHWQNMRIYDTPGAFAPATRAAALIASGFKMVAPDRATTWTPTTANIQVFNPGASV